MIRARAASEMPRGATSATVRASSTSPRHVDERNPGDKERPGPELRERNAAALHTDLNGSSATEDQTTRIGSRDRREEEKGTDAFL